MIDERLLANLLAYSAQVACIVALGTVLYYLLRIDVPRLRHAYWRTLLALCLLLPLLQAWPAPPPEQPAGVEAGVAGVPPVALIVSMRTGRVRSNEPVQWAPIAVRIAAAGIALRLLWTAIGLWQLRRLRRTGEAAEVTEHAELKGMVGALAEIRYVRGIDQPVTFGARRPVIVLPAALREHPDAVQRAVVCHELFHVRRHDWVWVLAEEAVRASFWFNPAVWWVISRIQLTREEAVDAAVVQATGERRVYLEALLAFADAAPLTPAAAFSRRRHLFTRMVLISKEAMMSSRRIVASCAVMAAAIAAGSWYAVQAFPLQGARAGGPPGAPRPGQIVAGAGPDQHRTARASRPSRSRRRIRSRAGPTRSRSSVRPARRRLSAPSALRLTLDASGRVAEVREAEQSAGGSGSLHPGGDRFGAAMAIRTRRPMPRSASAYPWCVPQSGDLVAMQAPGDARDLILALERTGPEAVERLVVAGHRVARLAASAPPGRA